MTGPSRTYCCTLLRCVSIGPLTITGWFDGDQSGALHYWRGMARHSPARDSQYLIIGPWTHWNFRYNVGDVNFPNEGNGIANSKSRKALRRPPRVGSTAGPLGKPLRAAH